MEAPFVEFRGCRQQGQVTAYCRVETGTADEIRRRYVLWKYAGPEPLRAQLNVRMRLCTVFAEAQAAISVGRSTGRVMCSTCHGQPPHYERADIAVCNCRMTCVVAGSVQDGAAVVMNAVASFLRASIEAPEAR